MPPQGPGWDSNPGWAPPPGPAPDPGWAPGPAQQPPGPPGWDPQPPGYGTPPPGMPGGAPVAKGGPNPLLWVALAVVVVAAAVGAYFVFAGGDEANASPEDAVRSYYNAAVDGDCGAMIEVVDLSAAGMSADQLRTQCQETYAGGSDLGEIPLPEELTSTRIVSESDQTAVVEAAYRMSDGSNESVELTVNNTDDGWRVDVGSFGGGESPQPPDTGGQGSTTTTEDDSDNTTTTEDDSDDTTTTTESSSGSSVEPPLDTAEGAAEPALEELAVSCQGGDMAACDQLWAQTDVGGELEAYAEICGGLAPSGGVQGDCEELYG